MERGPDMKKIALMMAFTMTPLLTGLNFNDTDALRLSDNGKKISSYPGDCDCGRIVNSDCGDCA